MIKCPHLDPLKLPLPSAVPSARLSLESPPGPLVVVAPPQPAEIKYPVSDVQDKKLKRSEVKVFTQTIETVQQQ